MSVLPALRISMNAPLPVSQTARVPSSRLAVAAPLGFRATPSRAARSKVSSPSATIERSDVGRSTEGRLVEATSIGSGHEVVLFIAGLRGTETAGTQLLERLVGQLALNPELLHARRVILVPRANPDGLAVGTRGNAATVDLGRDFPARDRVARAAAPQPETQALVNLIKQVQPTRIIALHQPLACIDYAGPARDLAQALSALGALNVNKLDAPAGSLGSWAGLELEIPVVILQLPGGVERHGTDQLWHRYGDLVLRAISYR